MAKILIVEDNAVKGFLVETPAPGYNATVMEGKGALRAMWNADIELDGVRVAEANRLPKAHSFKNTAQVLKATRQTCDAAIFC